MHFRSNIVRQLATYAIVIVSAAAPAMAAAPRISIQGDHFAINGTGQFLLLVSYFDALRASSSNVDADLQYFENNQIDGVRILWSTSHSHVKQ